MADDLSFYYPAVGGSTSSGNGTSTSQSSQSTQMIPGMQGVYQQLLGMNQANYGNVLNAYQTGQNRMAGQLPGIYQGYGNLQNNVLDTLGVASNGQLNGSWGVAAPAAQGIANTYQQQVAGNQQQLASAGLGNTTVGSNLNSQAAQAAALSYGQLGSQLAGQAAGYQAQIGQAGLGAQLQGAGMQTGLTQAALGPLGQQFSNTAGSLTGGFGNSTSSSVNRQTSQAGNQGGGGSGNGGGLGGASSGAGGVAGAPGGPSGAGGGSGGYSGFVPAEGGGGASNAPGYNFGLPALPGPYGATGSNLSASVSPTSQAANPGVTQGSNFQSGDVANSGGQPTDSGFTGGAGSPTANNPAAQAGQYGADSFGDGVPTTPPRPGSTPIISIIGDKNDSRIYKRVITSWT